MGDPQVTIVSPLEKQLDQRSSNGRSPSEGASGSAGSRVKPDPGRSAAKRDRRDAGDGDATEGEKSRDLLSTLWWTNIAIENGHRNSGFSH